MGRTSSARRLIAVIAFFALPCAAGQAKGVPANVFVAQGRPPIRAEDPATKFAVTPLVTPKVREFVDSRDDLSRSSLVGRIVVPLVLLLLIERELLAAAGRPERRVFLAFGLPLVACFAMLVIVRIQAYVG